MHAVGLHKYCFVHTHAGFQTGGSGELAIRFRPALIFEPKHANMFLEVFENVLKTQ